MRLIFVLFLSGFISSHFYAQSVLEKIQNSDLNLLKGEVKTYYSESYSEKAKTTQSLLKNSISFYEENFGVRENFAAAVIEESLWQKITQIPYGLPFVSGPPYIVCIPASSENVLFEIVAQAVDEKITAKYKMNREETVSQFISLIGFHEVGHIYAKKYGINYPNNWIYEFAATYFAYNYLEENFPEKNRLWLDVAENVAVKIEPVHRSLRDFEELYVRVGVENYAWYQVVFLTKVQEVYENEEIDFLKNLKDHQWETESKDEYLKEMDNIAPGFMVWAEQYKLK